MIILTLPCVTDSLYSSPDKAHRPAYKAHKRYYHMTREQFPWKIIREKVPYEGCTRQSDRAGKTHTALLEIRTVPEKTMRNNFVAKKCFLENERKANIPTVSSIIAVSFRTSKCSNYLLTAKQQKESHYSRNEAMLPRAASFHQRMKMKIKWSYDKMLID